MKTIISIIALLVLIGCGGNTSVNSVEYSSEQIEMSSEYEYSSFIIDLSSSSSVEIPLEYSSSDIVVTISSSSETIQSSSSIVRSSSSSLIKISSSSSIPRSSSSSSNISSSSSSQQILSSSIIQSSSSSIASSSSSLAQSSSSYKTAIYMFDVAYALGVEFYKTHGTSTSPDYEIIGNIIKGYEHHYGLDTLIVGEIIESNNIERRRINAASYWVKDLTSSEIISVMSGVINLQGTPFVASAVHTVNNKSVFVLKRTNWGDEVCFWYDTNSMKWIGSGTQASDANFQNVCGNINNYSF